MRDGGVGDLVAARRGRDDHGVGAEPFRPGFDCGLRLVGGDHELGSELGRQRATALDRFDTDDAAPGGAHHLHGEQSEQAEPDDDHAFSERRLGTANALQRDRPDRAERRVCLGNAFRDGAGEVPGTDTTSAWFARPAPAQATRCPTRKSANPPVSITVPALE